MTRFTVVSSDIADQSLAEAWLIAREPNAVAAASRVIDYELRFDPGSKGQPVREGLRGIVVPPLKAIFEVRESDRIVELAKFALLSEYKK